MSIAELPATLIESIRSQGPPSRGPLYIEISPVGYCNLRCIQCHQRHHLKLEKGKGGSPPANTLSRQRLQTLTDEIAELGIADVEICGRGEPTLYPDLPALLSSLKAKKLNCSLITNGIQLTADLSRQLVEVNLDEVIISMYAAREETFQSISRPGKSVSLALIAENTERLVKLRGDRPRVTLNFLLQRDNVDELEDMLILTDAVKADGVVFSMSFPYREKSIIREDSTSVTELQFMVNRLKDRVSEIKQKGQTRVPKSLDNFIRQHENMPSLNTLDTGYSQIPCYAGWWAMFLAEDGTIRPCSNSHLVLGDIYQDSLKDIWNSGRYQEFRKTALTFMMEKGQPLPQSYCTHCGWLGMNSYIHHILTTPETTQAQQKADEQSLFQRFFDYSL